METSTDIKDNFLTALTAYPIPIDFLDLSTFENKNSDTSYPELL